MGLSGHEEMKHTFRFLGQRSHKGWDFLEGESHHALNVVKLAEGDEFEFCDGEGCVALARVVRRDKRDLIFEVLNETSHDAEVKPVTLICGLLKPGVVDDVLPYLVELNVSKLILFAQQHSSLKKYNEKVQTRWQRIIHEAFKQSKRAYLPEIQLAASLEDVLAEPTWSRAFVLDADAPKGLALEGLEAGCAFLIGSESGLTAEELKLAKDAQFVPTSIAKPILRARTALIATLAIVGQALL